MEVTKYAAGRRARKRTKEQRLADRADVARRYLRGEFQVDIAKAISDQRDYAITQQQVSWDLAAIREEWKRSAVRDFDDAKAQELARIDELERTYWHAWERSLEAASKTTQHLNHMGDEGPKPSRAIVETTERVGDPRFLEGVQHCIDKRIKLLGLNAPDKIAPTDPTGTQPYAGVLTQLSVEELRSLRGAVENPGA